MSNASTTPPALSSRRALLQTFAVAASGAAMLSATTQHAAADGKMAPSSVGYRDKPNGVAQCDNCKQFVAPGSCKVVEGTIAPTGWCQIYAKLDA